MLNIQSYNYPFCLEWFTLPSRVNHFELECPLSPNLGWNCFEWKFLKLAHLFKIWPCLLLFLLFALACCLSLFPLAMHSNPFLVLLSHIHFPILYPPYNPSLSIYRQKYSMYPSSEVASFTCSVMLAIAYVRPKSIRKVFIGDNL